MKKIIFDSNAFDKLLAMGGGLDFMQQTSEEYEYYITPIQVTEIAEIPDSKKEKRIALFLQLCSMRASLLPAPAVVGHARLGYSKLVSDGEAKTLKNLSNGSTAHVDDDLIGTVAEEIGGIVITNDDRFSKRLKKNNISTLTFEDWMASVAAKC